MTKKRTAEELAEREARTIGWRVRDLMHRDYWVFVGDGFDGVEHAPPPMTHADAERLKALGHESYKPRLVRVLRKRHVAEPSICAVLRSALATLNMFVDVSVNVAPDQLAKILVQHVETVARERSDAAAEIASLRLAIRTGGAMLRGVAAELAESDEERAAILAMDVDLSACRIKLGSALARQNVAEKAVGDSQSWAQRAEAQRDELHRDLGVVTRDLDTARAELTGLRSQLAGANEGRALTERSLEACAADLRAMIEERDEWKAKCAAAEDVDRATWRVKYNAARVELERTESLLKRSPAVIEAALALADFESRTRGPGFAHVEPYRAALAAESTAKPVDATGAATTSDAACAHRWRRLGGFNDDDGSRCEYGRCVNCSIPSGNVPHGSVAWIRETYEAVNSAPKPPAPTTSDALIQSHVNSSTTAHDSDDAPLIAGKSCVWISCRPHDGGETGRVRFFVGDDDPVMEGTAGDVKWRVELKGAKPADVSDEALARANYEPRRCAFGGPSWDGLVEMERKSLLASAKGFRAMFEALSSAKGGN